MSQTIDGEYFPEDGHRREWTVFVLIVLAGAVALWLSAHHPPPAIPPPLAAPSAGMDRFLVLWMPEVPSAPEQTQHMRARYAQWLHALADNGYHPLTLSDISSRYRSGVGLPDHAVVIVFDPGYRHTFDTLSPIFMHYRVPSVWYINQSDLRREERRTIHSHMARDMQRSPYWDVGFHQVLNDWKFSPSSSEVIKMNHLTTQWAHDAGHNALNVGTDLSILNGLHVESSWTGEDLLNRLAMEWPLQSPAYLTVKPVNHYLWGVVTERLETANSFTLHAPLASTSESLFWLGTRGCHDFILTADVQALFGEAFFWLRSSQDKTEGLGMGMGHQTLFVDQMSGGQRLRIATVPMSFNPRETAHIVMRLEGDTLVVFWQGHPVIELHHVSPAASPQGIIRMTVYDRIRGAATLTVQQLQITPLVKRAFL